MAEAEAKLRLAAEYASAAPDYERLWSPVIQPMGARLVAAMPLGTAETILDRFQVRRVRVRIAKQNLGWTTGGRAVIEVERQRRA